MKDVVIIKLFKPEYLGVFHDLYLDEANADFAELKAYGKKINKTILFFACNTADVADFDCFAEISYSGALTDEEKEVYVDIIKRFLRDSEERRGELNIYPIHAAICFNRIALPQIIEV